MTRAPAPVPRLRRAAKRPRPSFVSRPAAAAALPPAMPLRGEPDRRHLPQTTAADRGLLVPRPPSQGKSRKGPQSLPGFRRQAAERTRIIFPGGMYVGENSFHGAKCRRPIADGPPAPERSAIAIGQTPCGRSAGAFQISSQKGTAFLRAPDPAALGGGTSDRRHWWGESKGETAEAPPVAEKARLSRGSGPIGGPEQGPPIGMPQRCRRSPLFKRSAFPLLQ